MKPPPSLPPKRHSFRPLLLASPAARPAAPARSAHDSHVRLRALAGSLSLPRSTDVLYLDAQELLEELGEDQLTMSASLASLESELDPSCRDASARAALASLAARLADLGALRDALAAVHHAMTDTRLQRVIVPDAPLADYLRGIYAWAHAALRAFVHLAASLRTLEPDWALCRGRLEEAKNFHFDELHGPARADLEALAIVAGGGSLGADVPPVEALGEAVETLFATAIWLETQLEERFG